MSLRKRIPLLILGFIFAAAAPAAAPAADSPLYSDGYDFGDVPIGSDHVRLRQVMITNRGSETVQMDDIALSGRGAARLHIWLDGCPDELAAGETCRMGVDLFPTNNPVRIKAHFRISTAAGKFNVAGPGFRGRITAPILKALRVPRRLPASGRLPLARVKCPMSCTFSVISYARIGGPLYPIDSFGPARLRAGKRAVTGLRFDREQRALLRRKGRGRIEVSICVSPVGHNGEICLPMMMNRIRG